MVVSHYNLLEPYMRRLREEKFDFEYSEDDSIAYLKIVKKSVFTYLTNYEIDTIYCKFIDDKVIFRSKSNYPYQCYTTDFEWIIHDIKRSLVNKNPNNKSKEVNYEKLWKLIDYDKSVFDIRIEGDPLYDEKPDYISYSTFYLYKFKDKLRDNDNRFTVCVKPMLSDIDSLQYSMSIDFDIFEEEEKPITIHDGCITVAMVM